MSKERELKYEKKNKPLQAVKFQGKIPEQFQRRLCKLVPLGEWRQTKHVVKFHHCTFISVASPL
jgi:hypothetical protein